MISSNLARRGHQSRGFVTRDSTAGKTAGLRLDSVIMTDNLATIMETELDSVLGRFRDMSAVNSALKPTVALD